MNSTSASNLFLRPSKAVAKDRSRSRERRPNNPEDLTKGYGCTIFNDHLILWGSKFGETFPRGESVICAYNLKEKRSEEVQGMRYPVSMGSSTACFYPRINGTIFYGVFEAQEGRAVIGSPDQKCMAFAMRIEEEDGSLQIIQEPAMPGPGSALSVCHVFQEMIYVYDPSSENDNFGSLRMHSFSGGFGGWQEFYAEKNSLRLNEPIRHALFINDVLYILAGNVDAPSQTVETGYNVIEDIYMLDLKYQKSGTWERISPSGRAPGALTNSAVAGGNEMIYLFGLSGGKSVLWVFNIREQEWKQVRDMTLTARPDQKALIHKGQLLIVEWDYSKDSIEIQYLSLDALSFVTPSTDEKEVCKDQAESFIQDTKNLYNGRLFHDVVFEVEGEQIPAHKAILASRSNYFMKMFTSGMSESHSAKIIIPNMKSHIFKALLQYIYCNEVELDEQLALDLIPVVDEYVMKGLKGLCEKYLCKQLRKENVVDMLIVADRHEIDELKKACFKFILKNLGNIDENEEMNKLSKSLFIELLKFSTSPNTEKKDKLSHKEDSYQQEKYATKKQNTLSGLFGTQPAYYGGGGGNTFGNR